MTDGINERPELCNFTDFAGYLASQSAKLLASFPNGERKHRHETATRFFQIIRDSSAAAGVSQAVQFVSQLKPITGHRVCTFGSRWPRLRAPNNRHVNPRLPKHPASRPTAISKRISPDFEARKLPRTAPPLEILSARRELFARIPYRDAVDRYRSLSRTARVMRRKRIGKSKPRSSFVTIRSRHPRAKVA